MHKPLLTLCLTLITLTAAAEAPPDAALMQQAEAGDAEAQFLVGRYYMHQEDWANAMPWFDKAAAQGHPKALNNGGIGYIEGRGVRQDIEKGCRMMEASYQKMGGTKGAANVAFCNDRRHDYSKALGYYRIAATQGDVQAQRLLGQMYGSGERRRAIRVLATAGSIARRRPGALRTGAALRPCPGCAGQR